MYCIKCGTKLIDTAAFCSQCGTPVNTVVDSDSNNISKGYSNNNQNSYERTVHLYENNYSTTTNMLDGVSILGILTAIFVAISFFLPVLEADMFFSKQSMSLYDLWRLSIGLNDGFGGGDFFDDLFLGLFILSVGYFICIICAFSVIASLLNGRIYEIPGRVKSTLFTGIVSDVILLITMLSNDESNLSVLFWIKFVIEFIVIFIVSVSASSYKTYGGLVASKYSGKVCSVCGKRFGIGNKCPDCGSSDVTTYS